MFTRRRLLAGGAAIGTAAWATRLLGDVPLALATEPTYGPLAPVADQDTREILALPAGFTYVTFGHNLDPMPVSGVFPSSPDGMGAVPGPNGTVRLFRNHELAHPWGSTGAVGGLGRKRYGPSGGGGCVVLDFDPATKTLANAFVALNGMTVNCGGGKRFNDTGWITCEENVITLGDGVPHGWCFDVGRGVKTTVSAVPLRAMGRFRHEAVAVDPANGRIYETEDGYSDLSTQFDPRSGFFRFRPTNKRRLSDGGLLDMLGITGQPGYDTRSGQTVGTPLSARWIPIPVPDPDPITNANRPFAAGLAGGGAIFSRLEGVHHRNGSMFFISTDGGDAGRGQLWEYHIASLTLVLRHEGVAGGDPFESPDNLTATPGGGLLLCEDDGVGGGDNHPQAPGINNVNRLIGVGADGTAFEFAVNRLNNTEFAGACFSPDGSTLFVNIYGKRDVARTGMTCAITGPWGDGPL